MTGASDLSSWSMLSINVRKQPRVHHLETGTDHCNLTAAVETDKLPCVAAATPTLLAACCAIPTSPSTTPLTEYSDPGESRLTPEMTAFPEPRSCGFSVARRLRAVIMLLKIDDLCLCASFASMCSEPWARTGAASYRDQTLLSSAKSPQRPRRISSANTRIHAGLLPVPELVLASTSFIESGSRFELRGWPPVPSVSPGETIRINIARKISASITRSSLNFLSRRYMTRIRRSVVLNVGFSAKARISSGESSDLSR